MRERNEAIAGRSAHAMRPITGLTVRGACLAHDVHDRVVAITNAWDRGVKKTDSLYVLKRTSMPAILIECGFLSNLMEREMLKEETYQQSIAGAIAEGIDKYIRRGQS